MCKVTNDNKEENAIQLVRHHVNAPRFPNKTRPGRVLSLLGDESQVKSQVRLESPSL